MANIFWAPARGARAELWLDEVTVAQQKYHTFLVLKNNKGLNELVLEGVPEKNSGKIASDYGRLLKKESTQIGYRHNPIMYLGLLPASGNDAFSYLQFKNNLLKTFNQYNDNIKYFPIPSLMQGTANSNSFTGSLLRKNNITLFLEDSAPGWDVNIFH
jgi:hypothetical protein